MWSAALYFSEKIVAPFKLSASDRFRRSWVLPRRKIAARSESWGYQMPYEEGGSTGTRLVCKTDFLQQVLEKNSSDLLILIKLHRYESDKPHYRDSRVTLLLCFASEKISQSSTSRVPLIRFISRTGSNARVPVLSEI